MSRKDMQWMRVAMYTPMYMGYCENAERPIFISDNDPTRDGDGWDSEGSTAGYWTVWSNFFAFVRDNPRARFDDNGCIDKG